MLVLWLYATTIFIHVYVGVDTYGMSSDVLLFYAIKQL